MTTTALAQTKTLPMTLAKLSDQFMALTDDLADTDPDDQIAVDLVMAKINALSVDWKEKAVAVAAIAREFKVTAKVWAEEAKRIAAGAKAAEQKYEWLRSYLLGEMQAIPVVRVDGAFLKIRRQDNSVKSMKIDNEAEIPERFKPLVPTLDTAALRAALEDGEVIPGAHLERGEHIVIW